MEIRDFNQSGAREMFSVSSFLYVKKWYYYELLGTAGHQYSDMRARYHCYGSDTELPLTTSQPESMYNIRGLFEDELRRMANLRIFHSTSNVT